MKMLSNMQKLEHMHVCSPQFISQTGIMGAFVLKCYASGWSFGLRFMLSHEDGLSKQKWCLAKGLDCDVAHEPNEFVHGVADAPHQYIGMQVVVEGISP